MTSSASGQITITAVGLESGTVNYSYTIPTISNPIGSVTPQTLASGNTTLAIPAGATLMIIMIPFTNTNTVYAKGVSGDTGVLLANGVNIISVANGTQASIVLTASGSTAGVCIWTF